MNANNRFEPPQPFAQQPHSHPATTPFPSPSEPPAGPPADPPTGPPAEPKKRSWFRRHKFVTAIGALILIIAISSAFGDSSDVDPTASSSGSAPAAPATPASDAEETTQPTEEEKAAQEPASPDEAEAPVGAFESFTTTGSGDSVIPLPEGIIEGIITATHEGSANFVINAIDEHNESTGDLAVNTIGAYSGTTAFGLTSFTDATALQINADGPWEITIAPFEDAPVAQFPLAGDSDAVFRYDGDAAVMEFSHQGSGHFSVMQTDDWFPELHVNEIGSYTGSVPVKAGPNYLIIQAEDAWTASE